jgi:hypothetical protein
MIAVSGIRPQGAKQKQLLENPQSLGLRNENQIERENLFS